MATEQENVKIGVEIDVDKARKQLDVLDKTIKELNENTDDTDELVKKLEKQWDQLNKVINESTGEQKDLAKQLKVVTKQLQIMKLNGEDNTEAYHKLLTEAGNLKDAMGDTAQAIKNVASDTSNLDAALGAMSAASGGFGLVTSAMSMFGGESENVEKAQKKLLQAVTLVNSVQSISNALNKDSALMVKLNSIAHSLLEKQMKATATATNTATTSMKGFKAALVSTGVGALVIALGFLVEKLIQHNDEAERAKTDEDALKSSMDKLKESTEFLAKAFDELKKAKEDYNKATFDAATDAEKIKIIDKEINEQKANLEGAKKQVEEYGKQVTKTGKTLASVRQQYRIFGDDFKESFEKAQAAFNTAKANVEGSKAQVLEFDAKITELQKKRDDITKKQAKDAKTASDKTKKYAAEEIQSRLNAAKARTQELKEELDNYTKSADAEATVAVNMRKKYGEALEQQFKLEKDLLKEQKRVAIKDAEGNYIAIKTAEQNYKNGINAIDKAKNKFVNSMDDTAVAVQGVFMKSEAEIQMYIDNIMKDIDDIDSRTKKLTTETALMGNHNLSNAFTAREDPEYLTEKKGISKQIEYYQELAKTRVDLEEQANQAIDALRRQDQALDENYAKQKAETWKDAAVQIGSYVGSTLSSIADMQDKDSKEGFERAKQLQYASTVVNTLSAMMGAYRSLVEIPIAGPALAAAAMTAAAAQGAAQLKQIKDTKFGDQSKTPSASTSASTNVRTGTSNVNTAILSRNIDTQYNQPQTQYVAIVDEITFKQRQQQQVQKVSVI